MAKDVWKTVSKAGKTVKNKTGRHLGPGWNAVKKDMGALKNQVVGDTVAFAKAHPKTTAGIGAGAIGGLGYALGRSHDNDDDAAYYDDPWGSGY
jgi:hypothetical protein